MPSVQYKRGSEPHNKLVITSMCGACWKEGTAIAGGWVGIAVGPPVGKRRHGKGPARDRPSAEVLGCRQAPPTQATDAVGFMPPPSRA